MRKTRIAVQRLTPDQLPVYTPTFTMKEAYQLYFSTPMGGIPSAPIPVSLPNVSGKDTGASLTPIQTGLSHNPIDAYQNRADTLASFGWGWRFEHDVGFLPFAGPQKRLVLPGGELVDFVQDATDPDQYRPSHPRFSAWRARAVISSV